MASRVTNPPVASALMATARSFGNYDLAAALADLIDNSIQARAQNVVIRFEPTDADVTVRIRDDGVGMSRDDLIQAMRPASSPPSEVRELTDLGRFGWGLKSASLSQAKILTVVTWRDGNMHAARWDIDDIEDWGMDLFEGKEAAGFLESDIESESGTEVIWTRSDRLFDVGVEATLDERLNDKITHARERLSLIFHRYLSGEGSNGRLRILLQGTALDPIDPFMSAHPSTQTLGEERISMRSGGEIRIQPYVLPHYSKLNVHEQKIVGGAEGMVRNQGFYVYRNKRLIIYGTWFRLVPHGELSQLTRVCIDLPNNLDEEWKITIDKSDAQLPVVVKHRLRKVVSQFNKRSVNVHRKKGVDTRLKNKNETVWNRVVHSGRIRYQINRGHPIIRQLLMDCGDSSNTYQAIKLIEGYIPTVSLAEDSSQQGEKHLSQAITDPSEYDSIIDQCIINYLSSTGASPDLAEFMETMREVEPFCSHWTYTESYIRNYATEKWRLEDDAT